MSEIISISWCFVYSWISVFSYANYDLLTIVFICKEDLQMVSNQQFNHLYSSSLQHKIISILQATLVTIQ